MITAAPEEVWRVITDLEGAEKRITGIQKLEILNRPETGFLGTKWKETRSFKGRSSTETMWISEVEKGRAYTALAESHGCRYRSEFTLSEFGEETQLCFSFSGIPLTWLSRLLSALMTPLFRGSLLSIMEKDLQDIKASVEREPSSGQVS